MFSARVRGGQCRASVLKLLQTVAYTTRRAPEKRTDLDGQIIARNSRSKVRVAPGRPGESLCTIKKAPGSLSLAVLLVQILAEARTSSDYVTPIIAAAEKVPALCRGYDDCRGVLGFSLGPLTYVLPQRFP